MERIRIRRLVSAAMFAALICAVTAILQVPSPLGGYWNLGDCPILLGTMLLLPIDAMAAAGIGAALADLLLGAAIYAPATLLIKGLMALSAARLYRLLSRKGRTRPIRALVCSVMAEGIMVIGYLLYELPIYGAAALRSALMVNLPQAAVNLVTAVVVSSLLHRANIPAKLNGGSYYG